MRTIKFILGFVFLFYSALSVYAEDISVNAVVDQRTAGLGESFQLTLSISGTQNVPALEIDGAGNFDISYRGPSTQISIVNGQMTSSISHIYSVTPLKTGQHVIGPVEVKIKGKTYSTRPITIDVQKGNVSRSNASSADPDEASSNDETSSLEDLIYLEMTTDKNQVYINEEIPLTIRLYFSRIPVRDIQYPDFSSEGFSKGKFAEPYQGQVTKNGLLFNMIEFKTTVYPVAAGQLTLGPAELKCNMLVKKQSRKRSKGFFDDSFFNDDVFDNFFGQQQVRQVSLKSKPLQMTVKSLPTENKPPGFSGAVGKYDFEVKVNPRQVKAGEPITLTAKIKGRGNIQAVTPPEISGLEKFKVYQPQVKTDIDQNKIYTEGEKTFEQVLIPTEPLGESFIPEIKFSYFDPEKENYQIITGGPVPITVTPAPDEGPSRLIGPPAENQKAGIEEKLGRDIIYIKTAPGTLRHRGSYIHKTPAFFVMYCIPFLGLITAVFYQRRKDRLVQDVRYARRQRALTAARRGLGQARKVMGQGRHEEALSAVFKVVQEYLGDKFNLVSAGITTQVIEEISPEGVPENIRNNIKKFFDLCDAARFAPAAEINKVLNHALILAEEIINNLEKTKKTNKESDT